MLGQVESVESDVMPVWWSPAPALLLLPMPSW
jgi:hypothetical protein